MTDAFINVDLNGYSIRAIFDIAGRELGYDDDIAIEINTGSAAYSCRMNTTQALALSKQLQASVRQMKHAQQGAQPDAFGAG